MDIKRQLIKSATSSAANYEESQGTPTTPDFKTKIGISYREMRESNYFLRVFNILNSGDNSKSKYLVNESEELKKILKSILGKFLFILILNSSFLFLSSSCSAQQHPQFSNYLFNNYGINPAYLAKGNCIDVKIGRRNQWVGFPNAPLQTFISINKALKKKAFRNYWHGIGLYLEQDKMDAIKSDAAYLNYSYHMRVSEDYFASFGMFAGAKAYSMSMEYFDEDDPAFQSRGNVVVPLDISVGGRLYSKTNFFDFAVRNTYMNKIKLGSKQMGTPSKMVPHINVIAGRRIESGAYYYTYVPSVNVRWALMSPPSVDLSFMMFIKKKIGFGLSYRFNEAIIGLFQYKYKNSFSIAFGYDYMLSRLRVGSSGITGPSSREIMLGFNSCPPGQELQRSSGCPAYDK